MKVPENVKTSKLSSRNVLPPKAAVSATTKRLISLLDETSNGASKRKRARKAGEPTTTAPPREAVRRLPPTSQSSAGRSIPMNVLNMPTLSSLSDQSVRRQRSAGSKRIQPKLFGAATLSFTNLSSNCNTFSSNRPVSSSQKPSTEIPPSSSQQPTPTACIINGRNPGTSMAAVKSESREAMPSRTNSLGLLGLRADKAKPLSRFVERHVAPNSFQQPSISHAVSGTQTRVDSLQAASAAELELSSSFEGPRFAHLPGDTVALSADPSSIKHEVQSIDHSKSRLSALLDIPAPSEPESSIAGNVHKNATRNSSNGNFVKLNLKNSNGSCRGRRTTQRPTKPRLKDPEDLIEGKQNEVSLPAVNHDSFFSTVDLMDPVDHFLDVASNSELPSKPRAASANPIPCCRVHSRPCKLCTVKKTSNKGRQFWVCSLPRGEQCRHFQWADDTVQAAQEALLRNQTTSGFIARQVSSYMQRLEVLTVPELHDWMHRHGIAMVKGTKKQQLKTRVAVWVRDQIANGLSGGDDSHLSGLDKCELKNLPAPEEPSSTNPLAACQSTCLDDDTACSSTSSSSSEDELEFFGRQASSDFSERMCEKPVMRDLPRRSSPVLDVLFSLFGYTGFREGQEWAIRRCLDNKRTLLVAPTGFGKSLCYAIPAAIKDGTCIVVSPLLSLIEDQLRMLPPRLSAATLSGSLTTAAMAATLDDIVRGRIKVVYVSPERLSSASFRRLFQPIWDAESKSYRRKFPKVSLLCVDEAHCLSQWAHNFRPSYLRMRSFLEFIQPEAILAITATAGPRVINNICNSIGLDQRNDSGSEVDSDRGTLVLKTDRDNIDVSAFVLETQEHRLAALIELLSTSDAKHRTTKTRVPRGCLAQGSVIVYVWRQRDAEVIAEHIKAYTVNGAVVVYHGGMTSYEREKAQSMFIRGKARICVATVAFGLGINKSDVRGVIHMSLASSAEHYLQEIGRAGRDGARANAIALILADEVLVRHSLAHTDLICLSQAKLVFRFIRKSLKEASSLLHREGIEVDIIRVGLPLCKMATSCDCKVETVETLLSLLELTYQDEPIISIDGICYDRVTIAPKRRSLVDLAEKELLARAIMACGTCVESPAGERINVLRVNSSFSRSSLISSSFGAFEFSVAACATFLGPAAESPHVFAALRRLEKAGELALALDTSSSGKSLALKVPKAGLVELCDSDEATLEAMSKHVYNQLHTTTEASARKSLELHSILMDVSEVLPVPPNEKGNKSASLSRFQELIKNYFATEAPDAEQCQKVETRAHFDELPSGRDFSNCVASILAFLTTVEASIPLEEPCVRIGDPASCDYTALVITKVLHGHSVFRFSQTILRSNRLFGCFQGTNFSQLLTVVKDALLECKP